MEAGINTRTDGQQYTGALFGRPPYVGLTDTAYGALTDGRQYTAYYTLLAPTAITQWLTDILVRIAAISTFSTRGIARTMRLGTCRTYVHGLRTQNHIKSILSVTSSNFLRKCHSQLHGNFSRILGAS